MAMGNRTLDIVTSGTDNVGVGNAALQKITTHSANVAIGSEAGEDITGSSNTIIGFRAMELATAVNNSTVVGYQAGRSTAGSSVVFIGYQAGQNEANSSRLYIANSNTTTPLVYGEFDNHIFRNYASTAVTAAVQAGVHRIAHVTSGVAAAGFGVSAQHELEDAGGTEQVASEVATLWSVATAGAEQPLRRWTTYPAGSAGPGYGGYLTADDVDNNALTIIPNGTGDVTVGLRCMAFVSESAGGTAGGEFTCLNGGNVVLYTDGVDTLTLAVAADGSATLQRTAGAATFDVSMWMVWV
jgi:hypothetical protein